MRQEAIEQRIFPEMETTQNRLFRMTASLAWHFECVLKMAAF